MRYYSLLFILQCLALLSHGQLESILIEKYYIVDSNDATDTTNGGVDAGAVTYRVYLDLAPGSQLLEIYGDASHPFRIASSESFFNNIDGSTFGYQIPKVSYESNTVALDTYLTLGQTGFQGIKKYFGIPKANDTDGSFIGGENNDGGSEAIEGGLLVNEDPEMGVPLTQADGMDTLNWTINEWFNYGVIDFISGADSTIFGINATTNFFESDNFSLRNSGVVGVEPDSNLVLVAQLTTLGELSFSLNAKILAGGETNPVIYSYVSTNNITQENESFFPQLNYPQLCGCTDPNFAEFSPEYSCYEEGSCLTPNVLGCMDTLACNYNELANVNVPLLCCYPGFCADRNIEEVCPELKGNSFDIRLYPNPVNDEVTLQVLSGSVYNLEYAIYNFYGTEILRKQITDAPLNFTDRIDVTSLLPGIYQMKVRGIDGNQFALFVKI